MVGELLIRPNWQPSVAYNGLFQCAKIDRGIIAYYGIIMKYGREGDRVIGWGGGGEE